MQRFKYSSSLPNIKHTNASAIAEAIINVKAPTRNKIAKYANVTTMTVCRAISKLQDAGFIQESAQKSKSARSGAASLCVANDQKFIIIDLTDDKYGVYLLSANYKELDKLYYMYNHSLDASDNLSICLERARAQFSQKTDHFSSIALITKDKANSGYVEAEITRCFSAPVTSTLEISDCLINLRASAIDSHFPAENMYYINLGTRNIAYFVTDTFTVKSSPQLLMDKFGSTVKDKINTCIGAEQLYDIIYNVVNSASAILDAKLFLIESDRFILGNNVGFSISEKLKLKFGDRRKMFVSDTKPPFYVKGAAIALQKETIKDILTK